MIKYVCDTLCYAENYKKQNKQLYYKKRKLSSLFFIDIFYKT